MPTVTEDLERGHRLTRTGWRRSVQRTFRVKELVDLPQYQLMEAMSQPEIPSDFDPYPMDPTTPEYPDYANLKVVNLDCDPDGPAAAVIVATYSNDLGGLASTRFDDNESNTRQVSFGTKEIKTTKDIGDADMMLTVPPSRSGGAWEDYKSEATVFKPIGRIVFEIRYEFDPVLFDFSDQVGTINLSPIGKYAAKTVLFSEYSSDGDNVNGWPTTFTFDIDPSGWRHVDIYKSLADKVAPPDAVEVFWDVIPTSEFSSFGFNWPT